LPVLVGRAHRWSPLSLLLPSFGSDLNQNRAPGSRRVFLTRPVSTSLENALKRDDFSSNRHPALSFCLSMIFSENRCTLFRIML
jgi:hypothetical protein